MDLALTLGIVAILCSAVAMVSLFSVSLDQPTSALDSTINVSDIVPTQYRGVHPYSFRTGVWGDIVSTKSVSMLSGPRVCWLIEYEDGMTDWVAVCDIDNYETQ